MRALLAVGVPLTASTLVADRALPGFRGADRRIRGGGRAGSGASGVPAGGYGSGTDIHGAVAADVAGIVGASAGQAGDAGAVDRWLRLSAVIVLPLCAGLGLGLSKVVTVLMGPAWATAGQAAVPLIVLMAWSGLMFPSGVALIAVGQVRFTLYANLASMAVACAGVLVVQPENAWQAVAIWVVGQIVVSPYSLWVNGRALGVGLVRPLTGGLRLRAAV